jgi:hypothetical protein
MAYDGDPEPEKGGDDVLAQALEKFEQAEEWEQDNRREAEDDIKFARLDQQWDEKLKADRSREGRPALTINRLPAFIRQVVNDSRQNKPSIMIHPVDNQADVQTAEVLQGLVRNIEVCSDADVAYDTAVDNAVTMGWGYWTVDIDYAYEDSFDLDIKIQRVPDPLMIYGDPNSTAADSSDWNCAFQCEWLTHESFEQQFKDAEKVDWDDYGSDVKGRDDWIKKDTVRIAKYWHRVQQTKTIVKLSDGQILDAELLMQPIGEGGPTMAEMLQLQGVTVVGERETYCHKVTRHLISGAEVLKSEDWPGYYIPIVPVYGDEIWSEGKRYLRSLIRSAKDAQRMYNYWRTTGTELVALSPRVPFIGPKGAFSTDAHKWATINRRNHPYVEYDGPTAPSRQQLDTGGAAGALQEALNASDEMKAIMGMFDASLGQRSNETSGVAIRARQQEGDVSTFHFLDNVARAIRCTGRILLDLIPRVYNQERVIRALGEDGTAKTIELGKPTMEPVVGEDGTPVQGPDGQPQMQPRIYDLAKGKYDLTVKTGPAFSTRREEAATQMMQMVQAYPAAAPIMGDLIAENLDWPGADEIAKRLKTLLPQQISGGLPPEVQQQMQEGQQQIQQLTVENQSLKADTALEAAKIQVEQAKLEVERIKAQTAQLQAECELLKCKMMDAHPPMPAGPSQPAAGFPQ